VWRHTEPFNRRHAQTSPPGPLARGPRLRSRLHAGYRSTSLRRRAAGV